VTSRLKLTGGFRYTATTRHRPAFFGDITGGIDYGDSGRQRLILEVDLSRGSRLRPEPTKTCCMPSTIRAYKAGGFNFGGGAYAPGNGQSVRDRFEESVSGQHAPAERRPFSTIATWTSRFANYAFLATGQPVQLTQNAGASRNYGAEADLLYKIPVMGTLDFSADYLTRSLHQLSNR